MTVDARTPTWKSLKAIIEARIEAHRDQLENVAEPMMAAEIRGRIGAYRSLIAAVEDRPSLPQDSAPPLY